MLDSSTFDFSALCLKSALGFIPIHPPCRGCATRLGYIAPGPGPRVFAEHTSVFGIDSIYHSRGRIL